MWLSRYNLDAGSIPGLAQYGHRKMNEWMNKCDHATLPSSLWLPIPPFHIKKKNPIASTLYLTRETSPHSTSGDALSGWTLPPPDLCLLWGLLTVHSPSWLPFPSSPLWCLHLFPGMCPTSLPVPTPTSILQLAQCSIMSDWHIHLLTTVGNFSMVYRAGHVDTPNKRCFEWINE